MNRLARFVRAHPVNTGPDAVNLESFTLVGVEFTFPAGATIEPNEFIICLLYTSDAADE